MAYATSSDNITWTYQGIAFNIGTETWNNSAVAEPGACVFDDKLYIYFTGIGSASVKLGLVTSEDGVNYSEMQEVLPRSVPLAYSEGGLFYWPSTPCPVVYQNDVHLFFDYARTDGSFDQHYLVHAAATDGINFTESDDVLLGITDTYLTGQTLGPSPMVDDNKLRLWFSGNRDTASTEWTAFVGANGHVGPELGVQHTAVDLSLLVDLDDVIEGAGGADRTDERQFTFRGTKDIAKDDDQTIVIVIEEWLKRRRG